MNCTQAGSCDPGYIPIGTKCLTVCNRNVADAASDVTNRIKTWAKDGQDGPQAVCAVVECLGDNVLVGGQCYEPCDTLASGVPAIANSTSKKYYKTGTGAAAACNRVYECDDDYEPNEAGTGGTPAAGTSCVDSSSTETYTMKDLVEHYLIHG
jgi:hypothetical protein